MIRRLFNFFKRGDYVYISPKKHSCWLPAGNTPGVIWRCKCGKLYKCRGLSMFADIIEWSEIKDEKTDGNDQ